MEAEICQLAAALRKRQRHYADAARELDRALEICDAAELFDFFRAECAVARADLATILGDPQAALELLAPVDAYLPSPGEAAQIAHGTRLLFFAALRRADAHAAAGDHAAAESCLGEARELVAGQEKPELAVLAARVDRDEARLCEQTGRRELHDRSDEPGNGEG